jgi:diguanylate cyclase (GGDEF)-like protein
MCAFALLAQGSRQMDNGLVKVLLVEDNRDYAWMLRLVFDEMDSGKFEMTHVEQFEEAVPYLSDDQFDVILLDLTLPDSQGFETFSRTYNLAPDVPIVIITAVDDKQLALRAVRDGAQDFLIKGNTDITQLVRAIQYAVERHRTLSDIKRLSLIDDLTGLLNRRGFISMASQHIKIAERANRELLLFFSDLDGLKQINDNFGHQEGDQALRDTATILQDTFRSSDLIARLGGDEFTVLAIDAPKQNIEAILTRLKKNIEQYNLHNDSYQLSLSIGVARFDPQHATNLERLLAQADKALYQHKHSNHKSMLIQRI